MALGFSATVQPEVNYCKIKPECVQTNLDEYVEVMSPRHDERSVTPHMHWDVSEIWCMVVCVCVCAGVCVYLCARARVIM